MRARERLHEGPLRQRHFVWIAQTLIAAFVARDERHGDSRAGPGMFGRSASRLAFARPPAGGERQRHLRRLDERASGHRATR